MTETEQALPLSHIRVLDLTRVRAGPTAVRQLADWGADVIKVELPAALEGDNALGGSRSGPDFQNLHRNKRGLTLDLKNPEGRALFLKLAETADVVVENFRPDVKHRLGVGYDDLAGINPRLIYASLSAFGEEGPYRPRPGVDQIVQGMSGLMSVTGEPDGRPMRVGIPVADLSAGLMAAMGVLLALVHRDRTGRGQWVQTSLLNAQLFMLDFQAARWLMAGEEPGRAGNDHPTNVPMGLFRTADDPINIAPVGQSMWRRLCEVLGAPEWADDPRYASLKARQQNRADLNAAIEGRLATAPAAHWLHLLDEAEIPSGPMNTIRQAFDDPQVRHNRMARDYAAPDGTARTLVGQPIALSGARDMPYRVAPERGADTDAILAELGYDPATIARLREANIV
mgnify:CR=1 FL=1